MRLEQNSMLISNLEEELRIEVLKREIEEWTV